MSEPPRWPSGGSVPFNAEKAAAWNEQWRERHAPKYGSFVQTGGAPNRAPKRAVNFDSPSAKVVLDIERQINGGQVLSRPPERKT